MYLKYFALIAIIFTLAIFSHNVYAVNSIEWIYGGFVLPPGPGSIPSASPMTGNIIADSPLTVRVDATDESNFTINGVYDTITVSVTSVNDPNVTAYILNETGPNTGIFEGTNFVFLKGNYKFQITDIVNLIYTIDPLSGCADDNTITQLDSRSSSLFDNGFKVYSNTDLDGVGLILTETGDNTCTFTGQVKFSASSTDETTGTLHVSKGDILVFEDKYDFKYYSGQILPSVIGKGSIIADFDDPNDDDTAEVTVTYNGLSKGLDLYDDGSGTGGGGLTVRPGLVLNFIASLLEGGGSNHSTPPTIGLNENQKRIVYGGFSFNDNPIDVLQYYTLYPLITTAVGQNNTIKLKIYEEEGLDNIAHVGLSYGLGKGETFNEGRATIEYDRTFDGKEFVTTFDPHYVLGEVNVTTADVRCGDSSNAVCREFTFRHAFREPLEYNMIATNIWDFQRNGWQNYFNHGIQITGESMNPPEQYSGIFQGHIYKLTETGKNTAIDDQGNTWTMDKIWNRDYIKPNVVDSDILNQQKITAIEQLGFGYSDGQAIFGFDRMDHRFADAKEQQQNKAQSIMNDLCPKCQNESYDRINDIFSYDLPANSKREQAVNQMHTEDQKAQELLKQYFTKIYPGRIYD